MSLSDLRKGIVFSMKENLMIQFVFPAYELPSDYKELIDTVNHSSISPNTCKDNGLMKDADVIVFNGWDGIGAVEPVANSIWVIRTDKAGLFINYKSLGALLSVIARLNIIITDIESFTKEDFSRYKEVLKYLSDEIECLFTSDRSPQINILTDRIMLEEMNNCNAGIENITLAPDGKFYICPAFYLADTNEDYGLGKAKFSIGDLENGLDIKNPQLYKLSYSPICRKCDAYQCKRCVWLNRKTTYEINTPGHEQCVIAHLERNAGRKLLAKIRKFGEFLPNQDIDKIEYLDPFEIRKDW